MHTAQISLAVLQQMFPVRLVSLWGDLDRPARYQRLPRLSMCDIFLWGYLKKKLFKHRPHTLEHLKEKITVEIVAIPLKTSRKLYVTFRDCLQQYIDADDRHFENIIFKKWNFLLILIKQTVFSKFYCSLFITPRNSSVSSAALCIILLNVCMSLNSS